MYTTPSHQDKCLGVLFPWEAGVPLQAALLSEVGSRVHIIAFLTRPRWPALTPWRAWTSWNNTRSPFLACWWWLISFPFVSAKIREVTLRLLKVRCLEKYNLHREFHKFFPPCFSLKSFMAVWGWRIKGLAGQICLNQNSKCLLRPWTQRRVWNLDKSQMALFPHHF